MEKQEHRLSAYRSRCTRTNFLSLDMTFGIKSLQKATHDMSRNFLYSYRLRALIVELLIEELHHG